MAGLPQIEVERSGEVEAGRSRKRESNYHILINTNKRPTNDQDAYAMNAALEKAVLKVFNDPRSLERIIRFNIANQHFDERFIQDISTTVGTETGSKAGRVHCHLTLRIKHTSNINVARSQREIKEEIFATGYLEPYGIDNLFVKVELLRDNVRASELYNAKDQPEFRAAKRKRGGGDAGADGDHGDPEAGPAGKAARV